VNREALTVLDRLATSLGRRDEQPNQELASEIVISRNAKAVKELVENLSNKDQNIASDCIKVLYEIGERDPTLIKGYAEEFGMVLGSKNNRLVWGGMTALDAVANVNPRGVHDLMGEILAAAEGNLVIARDHAVGILVKLASVKEYRDEALKSLLDHLRKAPDNQFPMYAEMSEPAFQRDRREDFSKVLRARSKALKKESQKKRVEKILNRLS
jgi:hypothetical protein